MNWLDLARFDGKDSRCRRVAILKGTKPMRNFIAGAAAAIVMALAPHAALARGHHGFPCALGQIYRPSMGICQGRPYHAARHARPVHHFAAVRKMVVRTRVVTRVVYRTRIKLVAKPVDRIVYRDRPTVAQVPQNPPVTAAAPANGIPRSWVGTETLRRAFAVAKVPAPQ